MNYDERKRLKELQEKGVYDLLYGPLPSEGGPKNFRGSSGPPCEGMGSRHDHESLDAGNREDGTRATMPNQKG